MTDKQFLLAVLADRREHRLSEILRRSLLERGHGMTVHSRAADLRRDGFTVACWTLKGQRDSVYQLVADDSPLLGTATRFSGPQREGGVAASSAGVDGSSRDAPSASLRATPVDDTESVAPALNDQPSLFEVKRGAYDDEWRAA